MKIVHRLLFVLTLAVLSGLPLAKAETCTDTTIPPTNPNSVYTVNGDGTATDTRSGLVWKQCTEGQDWIASSCSGSAGSYSWPSALTRAAASSFAGHSDWRLPSIKELSTLVEGCRHNPAINNVVFLDTPSSFFWSSSPVAGNSSVYAWGVDFVNGGTTFDHSYRHVRLVRGGQSFASFDLASIQTQTITFGTAPSVRVGGTGSVSATGGASGQPVTFASTTPSICTISGSLVSGLAVGTCRIAANQAGNGSYSAAPQVTQSFSVTVAPITTYALTVNSSGAANVAITASPTTYGGTTNYSKTGIAGGSSLTLTAPASVGSAKFSSWSGCNGASGVICSLSVNASSTVTASYQSLLSQTITFGTAPSAITVGGMGSVSATASSGLPVTFYSTTPSICSLSGSTVTGIAAGFCIVAANQPGDSTYSAASEMVQYVNIVLGGSPSGTTLFIDSFEGDDGNSWLYTRDTDAEWSATFSGMYPSATPHGGAVISQFNSSFASSGSWSRLFRAEGFAIPSNVASVVATFWMYHDTGYSTKDDRIQFQVSTNGVTWNNVGATQHRYNGTDGWSQVSLDLSAYRGQSRVQVGFLGTSAYGNNIYLDDLVVSAQSRTTAPDAPVIHTLIPGKGRISLAFSAPANNGGSAIVAYTATCTASNQPVKTASGTGLTLTVRGLKGGVAYACTVKASNALFASSASAAWAVIPQPASDLTPIFMLLQD